MDGVVLDAFFAVRASDGKKAILAAKQTSTPTKTTTLQDIYVLALAYLKEGAIARGPWLEFLRRKIREGRDC